VISREEKSGSDFPISRLNGGVYPIFFSARLVAAALFSDKRRNHVMFQLARSLVFIIARKS
jgi:hypothetical protein